MLSPYRGGYGLLGSFEKPLKAEAEVSVEPYLRLAAALGSFEKPARGGN